MRLIIAALAALLFAGSAEAANRFWVGGTGTWDNATTTHWATASGGGGGASVPAPGDTVTFDAASGGGTVTVAATIDTGNSLGQLVWGAFTGTLDFDANDPNITLTSASAFSGTGTGARKFLMGSGTWTFNVTTSSPNEWTMSVTTNLDAGSTFNASTILYTGNNAFIRGFIGGGLTYGTFTIATNASGGGVNITGANTFGTLNFTGPGALSFPGSVTTTITNAFSWTGSSTSAPSLIESASNLFVLGTVHASAVSTMDKVAVRDITFNTSAVTATNSYDLGGNSGITITAPAGSGGGNGIIGGGSN